MVYEGRPSRGCQTCKTRRIKCDETRPACKKCIKANRECPGMPEEVDLIFRAENPSRRKPRAPSRKASDDVDAGELQSLVNDIEQQKRRVESRRSSKQRSRSGSPEQTRPQRSRAAITAPGISSDPRFQTTLNPAIESEATDLFFMNFVLGHRSKETSRSFLKVTAPMFNSVVEGSALHLAVQAVAVAALGSWPGQQHLAHRHRSQRLYGRALNAIQRDLEHSTHRTSDATLLSVMMFALYESITSSEHSLQAWARHIEGAVTLVKARGSKQFKNPQSLLLFRAVRAQMLTNALQQRKEVPDFAWLGDIDDDECAATSFLRSTLRVPNLLAKAKSVFNENESFGKAVEVNALLQEARGIQKAFVDWESQMAPEWHYTSVAGIPKHEDETQVEDLEAWSGRIHVYEDLHVACIRNNNRVCQMLCCSVMMDSLKWLIPRGFELDDRYLSARARVQCLVDDICYSVPFFLHGLDAAENIRDRTQSSIDGEAVGSYFLVWPLWSASNIEEIPYTQRRWIRGRLRCISRRQEMNRAGPLSHEDKTRQNARRSSKSSWREEGEHYSRSQDRDGIPESVVEQILEADEGPLAITTNMPKPRHPARNTVLTLETPSLQLVPAKGTFQQNDSYSQNWPLVPDLIDAAAADALTSPANLLAEETSAMDEMPSIPKAAG